METVCVGIDTGGTFTDLVAVELERGRHHYHKVPTLTPIRPKASSNCSTGTVSTAPLSICWSPLAALT